ncbi:hypothetical protein BCV69DRAFT_300006 [Microstroma glucosiphilum]|uniref:1-phosphatidylinositol-3-phosphate 5-kinase n=1 Tax=Pseudomicrostroma glucosiphilum TaxID=1684307 RepID=A0A316U2Z8_9BASI|nr:hypothetical protein BCV69DRAFT_300006 [Pseudomicrostroma glucosiphilum]PWN19696.1 hypothetical protein BCV69DRAFT_300006 [Pseudomicrostroma glucosiphilum]
MASSHDTAAASRLTSFGFLPEEEDHSEGQYGIGQLLSKVKTVFTGSTSAATGNERQQQPPAPSGPAPKHEASTTSAGEALGSVTAQHDAADQRSRVEGSGKAGDIANRATATGALPLTTLSGSGTPLASALTAPDAHIPNSKTTRGSAFPAVATNRRSAVPFVPSSLRSTTTAPAIISLAPTVAVAQHGGSSTGLGDYDDTYSVMSSADDTHGEGRKVGTRSSLATLVTHARLPSTAIPGFPLSKDLLADDVQSNWSMSSRSPGSDSGLDQNYGTSTSSSLQTSAEAFRRLTLKGGASHSKEWWMPDHSAKECSACASPFGIARRRHHCRCCGQIFCSKCASNLLPGSKLGLPGVVRVCDFCTRMMKQYDLARAGGGSTDASSSSSNIRVRAEMISAPLEAAVENAPQSRFAANALFGASSFREGSSSPKGQSDHQTAFRPALNTISSSETIDFHPSRSQTPEPPTPSVESALAPFQLSHITSAIEALAPFRRRLAEDDQPVESEGNPDETGEDTSMKEVEPLELSTPSAPAATASQEAVLPSYKQDTAVSSVPFPSDNQGSPSKAVARNALDQARARLASDASISQESRARLVSDAAIRAYRRSRLRSRVTANEGLLEKGGLSPATGRDDVFYSDSRPSSRMGIGNPTQGLESHSQHYLRQLLDQCLTRAEIGNKVEWMNILLPLAVRVIQSVKPDATSRGKKMGVRRLVKIKRIAGGKPQDSHAMDGYICSRNVASKAMVRRLPLHNARVVLLSFPLTAVKGEGQYVSLDALTASEREYTRIMVARVLALRPHLLIVRDQVSRMALDMLEQAGIVVVWKVPESSMASIARVTQSDIVTSLDRLALQPRLGRCGVFAADTYHSMLLPGKRRSFLRFTGTPKELGCSIILRGGGQALLGNIKCILEFCLLAAHNLRLEESMRNVDLALLPEPRDFDIQGHVAGDDQKEESPSSHTAAAAAAAAAAAGSPCQENVNLSSVDAADGKVISALQDYRSTLLSMSARLQIPPPYPLIRLRNEQAVLNNLKSELESDKDAQRIQQLDVPLAHSPVTLNEKTLLGEAGMDGEGKEQKPVIAASEEDSDEKAALDDPTPTAAGGEPRDAEKQPSLQADEQPSSLDEKMDVEKQVSAVLPSSATMNLQTRFAVARSRHAFDVRFLPSLVDVSKEGLTPFCHQRLTVLHSFINSSTLKPCIGPRIEQMEFYGKEDHTLGDFLDSKCVGSSQVCKAKNCGLQQILHYDSYIHHQVRIQCFCERFVCPIAGQELSILTWEYCKVCETATPVSVVNDIAKAYSWAKFLEAHFYTKQTRSSCPHESLVDRIRYFAYKNLAFRIHVELVEPFDVVIPGLRLFMRPDIQSTLKAEESLGLARRADAYFHSVGARLKALEHEVESCRDPAAATEKFGPHLRDLRSVAMEGRGEVNRLLVAEVVASGPGDTLCLNKVRQKLQGSVVKVDELFTKIERLVLPKDRDLRRTNANQLGRLFMERDSMDQSSESKAQTEPPSVRAVEEGPPEGLPQSHTNSSLSALAMIADSAAFGLPTHLGISFEETPSAQSAATSTAPSGTTTPTTTGSANVTKAPSPVSLRAITEPPAKVEDPARSLTSSVEQLSPQESLAALSDAAPRPKKDARKKGQEDSDGFSSPTDRLKPLTRSKPRKGKESASLGSTITDSSCTEAGESTDGGQLSSSFARVMRPLSKATSKGSDTGAPDPVVGGRVGRARQHVLSDGDTQTASGPTSPTDEHFRRLPSFARTQSSSVVERSSTYAKTNTRGSHRSAMPPPSSYKPPATQRTIKASESESDAPSVRRSGVPRQRAGGGPSLGVNRPKLSRRVSGKSDSGNESQPQAPKRGIRRDGGGGAQMTSLPPIAVPRTPSRVPLPTSVGGGAGRVSTIARHFDRINRNAEKEREKQRRALVLRARRALPIAASSARIAEYTSVSAAVESDESSSEEDGDDDDEAESSSRSNGEEADSETEPDAMDRAGRSVGASLDGGPKAVDTDDPSTVSAVALGGVPPTAPASEQAVKAAGKLLASELRDKEVPTTPSGEASNLERGSLLKTISSFWASRAGIALPLLEYPLSAEQHLFADSPLLLREDEPSSTIAFTLVSAKYQERLRHLRASRKSAHTTQRDPEASTVSWGIVSHRGQDEEIESSLRRPEGVHLRFDFESGASRFHCRILFSEQFDALRRCCGCEDSFITSLARCLKWDSSGGKSGMTFLKTRDDRLVLKQLSSSELASFSTFAPHYFAHMADCLMHGKPTTLAKIFGLFRISMRNQATGKSYKLDVLVMEHLFYGRQCARIFDLKGSMRNRYVKETGAPGEVLQDENLVEISLQRPLFIREGSKVMLHQALVHDSQFLAEMNIMDYSVIVGIDTSDEENHELVVGIIDFLRSYTWDKRVETFVKEQSSLLGAAKGELPTVITPKQYASRFLSFLDGIFLLSPDAWYHDTSQGPSPHNPNSAGNAAPPASTPGPTGHAP